MTKRMPSWQPIETAPKNRFVLLYCHEDNTRWLAKWQGGRWHGVDEDGLTREGMGPDDVTGWEVVAWAELPEPPLPTSNLRLTRYAFGEKDQSR